MPLGFFGKCDLGYQMVSNESRYFSSCYGIFQHQSISKPICFENQIVGKYDLVAMTFIFCSLMKCLGIKYRFSIWVLPMMIEEGRPSISLL